MYELNAFFWYKALFTVELIIAEMLIVLHLRRRSRFALRAAASVIACIGFSLAIPVVSHSALYTSFIYLVIFAFSVGAIKFCFKESLKTAVFCGIAGYTAQHVAYALFEIFVVATGLSQIDTSNAAGSNPIVAFPLLAYGSGQSTIAFNPFTVMFYLGIYGVAYFAFYKFVSPRLRSSDSVHLRSTALFVLVIFIVLIDIIISAVVSEYSSIKFDKVYIVMQNITNIMCCMLCLYIQFNVALLRRLESDLAAVEKLRDREAAQFELMKDNINRIDIKCHDLKHRIRTIGVNSSIDPEAVEEIEKLIVVYDSRVRTGNKALDTILTEKSLLCNDEGIVLSCMADGELLSFMTDGDIYSLFGNLVDNAIEAVMKLERDLRSVSLSVKSASGLVYVGIYNRYDGQIKFEGGLPLTTKNDRAEHGYGMKSVRMLVEKYGGEMKIKTEGGIFELNIVFPQSGI